MKSLVGTGPYQRERRAPTHHSEQSGNGSGQSRAVDVQLLKTFSFLPTYVRQAAWVSLAHRLGLTTVRPAGLSRLLASRLHHRLEDRFSAGCPGSVLRNEVMPVFMGR
jgi:hypothetical protein